MWSEALPIAVMSGAAFAALALMEDRVRGAFWGQAGLVVAGALFFVALALSAPESRGVAGAATGLLAAAGAGMFYHLYRGRFDDVWRARAVFFVVYLAMAAVFGLVFLSLI